MAWSCVETLLLAGLAAGVLALGLGACAENKDVKVTDLNNLQGDVIGKVNAAIRPSFWMPTRPGFAEFAGQWMTAEALGEMGGANR